MTDGQIHPDIPFQMAWSDNRRVYVKTGYRSPLDAALREIGAKWDPDARALWVGRGKVDRAVAAILMLTRPYPVPDDDDPAESTEPTEPIYSVEVPDGAPWILSAVKAAGFKYNARWRMWSTPDEAAWTEIINRIGEWTSSTEAVLETLASIDRDHRAKVAAFRAECAAVIKASGRTPVGNVVEASMRVGSPRGSDEAAAKKSFRAGSIQTLEGRTVLITTSEIVRGDQEDIADGLIGVPWDVPGWFCRFTYVEVLPVP